MRVMIDVETARRAMVALRVASQARVNVGGPYSDECGELADELEGDIAHDFVFPSGWGAPEAALTCSVCQREALGFEQRVVEQVGLFLAQSTFRHERGGCSSVQAMDYNGRVVSTMTVKEYAEDLRRRDEAGLCLRAPHSRGECVGAPTAACPDRGQS